MAERYTCPRCGATYHLKLSPPRALGICDNCGENLEQRSDDRRDVVQRRLEVYENQTAPVINLYRGRGILIEVDGAKTIDGVLAQELTGLSGLGLSPVSRKA